ncbi:Cyclophilin type peptidyl-prolyl cis-trans isomerase/CLD [Tsuneonella dongtanensis]|uniref:Cyclophilin type peptidyl-prolyl cis-trans isomerase/CLD n=1 Tax=Tsuneonella dongtanensis TaxID=692370 RepID=A0A1B2ADK7_9SPHN|nr:peptidylprolyl isomerase [Tsuneonella dongtanensis]ANY20217.1 Cyclophilin type peptidyl-prolyl cis-trans isomerase/CLD [Tsuneonella dongtanensis]
MTAKLLLAAALLAAPALAQEAEKPAAPSPNEIVAAAPASEWVAIAPDDLLVMDLAPDRDGKARRVVIQFMPPPFSHPWVANIRTLAKAHWWDGLAIGRAQDNYVVQWGDPDAEDAAKAKTLPKGLQVTSENRYVAKIEEDVLRYSKFRDSYAQFSIMRDGWPVAVEWPSSHSMAYDAWPVHCYGSVGVGRNMPPDAGTGAELYTVIGHAPRHLDRNIAVVGRVIEGIEHLSTLPRGTGPLGFYETPEERVPIAAIRLGSEVADLPAFQYLSTDGEAFARYADARANRRDPFFIVPAGGADVCNIPVPVRRAPIE